jgi:hypothetical protein
MEVTSIGQRASGEFRGYDNPELITALHPAPQVIFKMRRDELCLIPSVKN